MITLDRSSNTPIHEQLVEQLRYLIASGHFKIDETLPSTRALGKQISVSFHTVRKAYQQLEREGLLAARTGSGYSVKQRVPLSKGVRMERGAAVVQDALQRLIGLGLEDAEIEYLFQEQLTLLDSDTARLKIVFAAPYREMADLCAEQVALVLQQPVEPTTLNQLGRHQDADYIVTPFAHLPAALERTPRADVLGVTTHLAPTALSRVARLLSHETLCLVTRYADAIAPLSAALRAQAGFSGQILAATVEDDARHVAPLMRQSDLIVYTPACRRRLRPHLRETDAHVALPHVVSRDSLEMIRQAVPA